MSNLQDELDREFAEAWRPAPGDKLVGVVVDVSERDGTFGRYPIVTLRTDGGAELAVHAFHEVLAGELGRVAPKVGDRLGVKYLGKHEERGYHRYKVRRDGATAEVDWQQYSGADSEPVSLSDEDAATQAALEGERAERDEALSTLHAPLRD